MKQTYKKVFGVMILSSIIVGGIPTSMANQSMGDGGSSATASTYSVGDRMVDDSDFKVRESIESEGYFETNGPTKVNGKIDIQSFYNHKGGDLIINNDETNIAGYMSTEGGDCFIKTKKLNLDSFLSVKGNLYIEADEIHIAGYVSAKNIYVYDQGGNAQFGSFVNGDNKLKIYTKTTLNIDGYISGNAIYTFGKVKNNSFTTENKPESGFFAKIDPFLIYNLEDTKITEIKNIILVSTKKVSGLKNTLSTKYSAKDYVGANTIRDQIYNAKVAVFEALKPYIENTDFDRTKMEALKVYELNTTVNYLNSFTALGKYVINSGVNLTQTGTETNNTTVTTSTQEMGGQTMVQVAKSVTLPTLPDSLKVAVDKKIASIATGKQEAWIGDIIDKLEVLQKKKLSKKNLALIGSLKAYLEAKLEDISVGDGGEGLVDILK